MQRIVEIYRRNGRFDVRVEPKIIELPNNRVDLVFEINEGGKTGVKKIIFVGNNAYSDTRLKDEIKTAETIPLIGFLKTTDIYDPDRIEADRDLLRRFYLKNGYADVRIVSAVASYDPEQKGFIVTFTIEEGERYRFGKVEIMSNVRAVDANALYAARCASAPGGVYNAEAVEKSVEDMTSRWRGAAIRSRSCARAATATSRRARSTSPSWSRRARASTSSASTSAATPAPATTSSGASSISPRATPTTAR